jgi:hypothetical protein
MANHVTSAAPRSVVDPPSADGRALAQIAIWRPISTTCSTGSLK